MSDLSALIKQASYWVDTNRAIEGNKYYEQVRTTAGISKSTAWCAAFVYACAKKTGNLDVIGKNFTAPGICHTVVSKGGKWIKGPAAGCSATPQPGDLILIKGSKRMQYKADGSVAEWHGKHVGLVYKVTSKYVYSYEGNAGQHTDRAVSATRALSKNTIEGYARPKWSYDGPLYKTKNDRHDMTLREVGYMNSKGSLTTSDTGVKIAIINYTTLLGDLYDMFARHTYGKTVVSTSKLKGNEKIVVDYLLDCGFNAAAACGIAANIKTDSGYNPAKVSGSSCGICLWTGVTAGLMRMSVGAFNWATNLSGQLDFLTAHMEEVNEDLMDSLYAIEMSSSGAARAADLFAKEYRGITSTATRKTVAKSIYSNIVTSQAVKAGTTTPTTPKNTDTSKIIDISKTKQKALSSCWQYMDVGRCSTDIINEWKKKGSGTSNGLAYLDGCYVVSTHSSLACKVNDYLEVQLSGAGTLKCIVGGLHSDTTTPLQIFRPRSSNINLKNWATTTIKQIKDFGARKGG